MYIPAARYLFSENQVDDFLVTSMAGPGKRVYETPGKRVYETPGKRSKAQTPNSQATATTMTPLRCYESDSRVKVLEGLSYKRPCG